MLIWEEQRHWTNPVRPQRWIRPTDEISFFRLDYGQFDPIRWQFVHGYFGFLVGNGLILATMNCEMVSQAVGTSDSKRPVTCSGLCRKNGLVDVLAPVGSIILIVWLSILGSDWPKYVPKHYNVLRAGRSCARGIFCETILPIYHIHRYYIT